MLYIHLIFSNFHCSRASRNFQGDPSLIPFPFSFSHRISRIFIRDRATLLRSYHALVTTTPVSTLGKLTWIHPIRNISSFLLLSRSIIYSLVRRIESVEERLASAGRLRRRRKLARNGGRPPLPFHEGNPLTARHPKYYIYIPHPNKCTARLRASNRFVKQPGHLNLLRINKPLETDLQLASPFPSSSNILLNTPHSTPALLFYLIFRAGIDLPACKFQSGNSVIARYRNQITGNGWMCNYI